MKKKIIIFIIGSCALVYWLQFCDKNFKNKSKFDKLKLPIITSALVGLVSLISTENSIEKKIVNQDIFTEIPNF